MVKVFGVDMEERDSNVLGRETAHKRESLFSIFAGIGEGNGGEATAVDVNNIVHDIGF